MLLMYAEVLNELGQTPQALTFVNQIRDRADLAPLSGLSQAAAREAIAAGASPEEVVSLVALVDAAWRDVVGEAEARLLRVHA